MDSVKKWPCDLYQGYKSKKGQKHKCWETIKNTNPINIIKKFLPDQIFCGFFKQLAFYGKNIHNMDQTMTIGHKA